MKKWFWSIPVLVILALIGWGRHVDIIAFPDDPPFEIKSLLVENEARCYVYSLGGFIDDEYLWRIDANPEVIASIVHELNLGQSKNVPCAFWQMPPYYWPRSLSANMMAYKSPDFPDKGRGDDGKYYFLLHDKSNNRAYVWYKRNF